MGTPDERAITEEPNYRARCERRLAQAKLAARQVVQSGFKAARTRMPRTLAGRLAAGAAALAGTGVVIVVLAVGALAHRLFLDRTGVPGLDGFLRFQPPTTGEVFDARGELLIQIAHQYREVIRYEDIPPVVEAAVLAAEDKNFFEHRGIDPWALPRVVAKVASSTAAASWRESRKAGEPKLRVVFPQGGSSITQQLVRGYFLADLMSRESGAELVQDTWTARLLARVVGPVATNKLVRKLEEARLSLWLEDELTRRFGSRERAKREILARYASFIYLGQGRYGFAAASEFYFGRPLPSLGIADAAEVALLAGITKSPGDYAPRPGRTDGARRRRDEVLGLMVANGFFGPSAAELARRRPIRLAERPDVKTEAPAVIHGVFDELKTASHERALIDELVAGNIRVHTTVEQRIQRIVNEELERGLLAYEKRRPRGRGLVQGSVVVLRNADAAVLAEAGGRATFHDRRNRYSDLNRVRQSLRQPGSALKPFVYLAGLRQGIFGLDTYVPDLPISVPTLPGQPAKWISNYDHEFKGWIPMRQALAESRNVVAIWIAKRIGLPPIFETLRDVGIHSPMQPYATTVLGASEVTLLELANGYRTLASGIVAEPHAIESVIDAAGTPVVVKDGRPRPLDRKYPIALIQEGLRGVVRLPGGTAGRLSRADFPVAVMGKTGTTSNFRDALFVGSTWGPGGITVAVRVGFDDNRELGRKETGSRVALPIFEGILQRLYTPELLGEPPSFPERIEEGIDGYLESLVPVDVLSPDQPLFVDLPLPLGRAQPALLQSSVQAPPDLLDLFDPQPPR